MLDWARSSSLFNRLLLRLVCLRLFFSFQVQPCSLIRGPPPPRRRLRAHRDAWRHHGGAGAPATAGAAGAGAQILHGQRAEGDGKGRECQVA